MNQRRGTSLIESIVNYVIGGVIAFGAQVVFYPMYGISLSAFQTLQLAIIFCAISVPRQYIVRRIFEWLRVTRIMP